MRDTHTRTTTATSNSVRQKGGLLCSSFIKAPGAEGGEGAKKHVPIFFRKHTVYKVQVCVCTLCRDSAAHFVLSPPPGLHSTVRPAGPSIALFLSSANPICKASLSIPPLPSEMHIQKEGRKSHHLETLLSFSLSKFPPFALLPFLLLSLFLHEISSSSSPIFFRHIRSSSRRGLRERGEILIESCTFIQFHLDDPALRC